MKENRKQGDEMFNVKCEIEYGKFNLSVTHDGYQWSTIRLHNAREIQNVVRCLMNKIPVIDVDDYYDDRCNCGTEGFRRATSGCPIHGTHEFG